MKKITILTIALLSFGQIFAKNISKTSIHGLMNASYNKTQSGPPIALFTEVSKIVCSGSPVQFKDSSQNSPTAWQWIFNGGTPSSSTAQNPAVVYSSSGTYTVTLIASNSGGADTVSKTVTITVNALPNMKVVPASATICQGNQINMYDTNYAASSYSWTPASAIQGSSNTASVIGNPTVTTTYTIIGTGSNGCSITQTRTITVTPTPTVTVSPSSITICSGGFATLTASGAASYTWTPAAYLSATTGATVVSTPTMNETYSVVGTTSGCSSAAVTASVNMGGSLTMSITPTSPSICMGSNVTLTANGASSYTWSPTTTLNCTTCASPIATPTVSTTYKVVGTSGSCKDSVTTTVTVNAVPAAPTAGSNSPICAGQNINLTSSGTGTYYNWTGPNGFISSVQNPTITGATTAASGTYSVTTKSSAGCTSASTTIPVTVNATPVLNVSGAPTTICSGNSSSLTASGASTYVWAPPSSLIPTTGNNVTATPTANTIYTVTGTSSVGCTNSATVAISVMPTPTVTLSAGSSKICSGSNTTITASGANTYTWAPSTGLSVASGSMVTASPNVTTTYTVSGNNANGCTGIATITITVDNGPTVALSTVNESCNGLQNANITANVSGGIKPYTYLWNTGSQANLIYNLAVGSYSVTVKDSLGCSTVNSATVSQPAILAVSVSDSNTTCGLSNGVVMATASGGTAPYNYSWSTTPAQTEAKVTGLVAGTYSVTVTDGAGCTATNNGTITSSTGPAITPTVTNSTCNNSNGKISVVVANGTAPYRYSWNNGDTLAVNNNIPSGIYIVTVTDANGCSTFDAINVTDAGAPTINVTSTNVLCNGDTSGSISVTASGGTAPYKYLWSTAATTSAINNLSAGPYQVTVTDKNKCTLIQTINITQPAALSVASNTTSANCGSTNGGAGVTVSGGVKPCTYIWSTGSTNKTITGIGVGTYTCNITDSNGCKLQALASVSSTTGPHVTLDSVINMDCATKTPGEIQITATGGVPPYTYLWTNGATTQNIANLSAGNYGVTVTDAAGCAGSASASITTALPVGVSICMVTVDPATDKIELLWSIDQSGRIAKYYIYKQTTAAGVFNKIGYSLGNIGYYIDTNSNANLRSWQYEISELDSCGQPSPISASVLFQTIHLTATLNANKTVSLVWDNFEGASFTRYVIYRDSIPGIAQDSITSVSTNTFAYVDSPPLSPSGNWYYHIGIGGVTGCTNYLSPIKNKNVEAVNYNASKSNSGNIVFNPALGIANVGLVNNGVEVYPNPNSGMFNIDFVMASAQNVNVEIYNTLGQVIERKNFPELNGRVTKQFDLSEYSKGVYYIKVSTPTNTIYKKVVTQ